MTSVELCLAHQKDIRAFARTLTRSADEAEDLVAATLELLPAAMERYRGDAQPRTFVLGICANLARQLHRSAARRNRAMDELANQPPAAGAEADPEALLLRRELAEQVLAALERLPEDQRTAFMLVGVEGYPASEVAVLTGVPAATVRSRLFHARRKIQQALTARSMGKAWTVAILLLVLGATGALAFTYRAALADWVRARAESAAPRNAPSPLQPPVAPSKSTPAPAPVPAPAEITRPARAAPRAPSAAELYQRAHTLHFIERRHAEALVAWDVYLRADPSGRFAPEAHYNRGVALLRLGRLEEARQALTPFAEGRYDDYRREDAARLISSIAPLKQND